MTKFLSDTHLMRYYSYLFSMCVGVCQMVFYLTHIRVNRAVIIQLNYFN